MILMNWRQCQAYIKNVTFPRKPLSPKLDFKIIIILGKRTESILPVETQIKVEYHVLPLCSKKLLLQYKNLELRQK